MSTPSPAPSDVPAPSGVPAPSNTSSPSPEPSRSRGAIAGVVAALVALGIGELVAGVMAAAASPTSAVGSALIDLAPPGTKEVFVGIFGTNDKPALAALVAAAVLLLGAEIGIIARRRFRLAAGLILAIVGVGALAALRQPGAALPSVLLVAGVQAGAAIWTLSTLLAAATPTGTNAEDPGHSDTARRGFLVRAGLLGGLAVVGAGLGRVLLDGRSEAAATAQVTIPPAVDPAPTPAPEATLAVDGITPVVTPNDAFYKVDTALVTPAVDLESWRLRVHGMVDREVTLTFDDLVELPLVERYVTIACVSNGVGGNLIGNAKWTGVRLTDVLEMAGVQPGATQVVPRSVDGWTAGFPTEWVTAPDRPRDALIAVRMNGEPLPAGHGFPARLIVPGLYGYVSATKWLSEIELTTLEAFDAYWVPRGWAKEAPILTQSRIDVPRANASVAAGAVAVAGVAWAPDRGIAAVEVSVDDGAWQPATLAEAIGPQTWVQWRWTWQAAPGDHQLQVRATDGTGEIQTAETSNPAPDGARGHHRIAVRVG